MNLPTTFQALLSRADEDTLASLLGRDATRLLSVLDPALVRPSRLRDLVVDLRPPEELLRNPEARKTIIHLLRKEEALDLATKLGLDPASPYEKLLNLSIRKGSRQENALFREFRIVPSGLTTPDPEPAPSTITPSYGLFEHQRRAVRTIRELLGRPPHRALLHMPTGSGKTRTTLNLICEELRRSEPSLVIWLAYSEELCQQTVTEFEEAWRQLGDRPLPAIRHWGPYNADHATSVDGLMVAGLGKMYQTIKRSYQSWARLADRTTLVVIDEAHQAVAPTYQAVLELLVERHSETRLLGLTATPGRTWNDLDEDGRLSDFFARQKVSLQIPDYQSPIDYLVDEGYLARVTFRSLHYHGGSEIDRRDIEDLSEAIDIPSSLLKQLALDEQRNLLVLSHVEELASRHQRVLVFAATVEHARLLAVVLRARGLDAAAVTGATPGPERERLIRRYRAPSEECRILCNFGVLTTGFDAPLTSAAVIARPTKSLVLYSQMVGRAMRGRRAGGNDRAEIVTVVDTNLPGFRNITEAFENWEDVWDEP